MINKSKVASWLYDDIKHFREFKKEFPDGYYGLDGRDENNRPISEYLWSLDSKRKGNFMVESINFLRVPDSDNMKSKKSGHIMLSRHPNAQPIPEDYFSSKHIGNL